MLSACADALRVTGKLEYRNGLPRAARNSCGTGSGGRSFASLLEGRRSQGPRLPRRLRGARSRVPRSLRSDDRRGASRTGRATSRPNARALLGRHERRVLLDARGPRAIDPEDEAAGTTGPRRWAIRSPPCSACCSTRSRKRSGTRGWPSACFVSTAARWRRILSRTPTYSRRSIYTRGNRERSSWWHGVAAKAPPICSSPFRSGPTKQTEWSSADDPASPPLKLPPPFARDKPLVDLAHGLRLRPPLVLLAARERLARSPPADRRAAMSEAEPPRAPRVPRRRPRRSVALARVEDFLREILPDAPSPRRSTCAS